MLLDAAGPLLICETGAETRRRLRWERYLDVEGLQSP